MFCSISFLCSRMMCYILFLQVVSPLNLVQIVQWCSTCSMRFKRPTTLNRVNLFKENFLGAVYALNYLNSREVSWNCSCMFKSGGSHGLKDMMVHLLLSMMKIEPYLGWCQLVEFSRQVIIFRNWRLLQKHRHAFNACVWCPIPMISTFELTIRINALNKFVSLLFL